MAGAAKTKRTAIAATIRLEFMRNPFMDLALFNKILEIVNGLIRDIPMNFVQYEVEL